MQPKFYGAAAQYNKPNTGGFGQILRILGIVIGVIILITLAYFGYMAFASAGKNSAAQLVARQKQLLTFMTSNQAAISSDAFTTVNSNAISLANTDAYNLTQGLRTYGLTSVPETIAKTEADTTSAKTLATARIQNRFDVAYQQLLRDKIAATQQLAQNVLNNSNGTMKAAAQTLLSHLSTIDEQVSKLQL